MIYSDNTYDITNNIATYTRRDFKSVFDTTSSKWYMLNNLNNYEEYGIYGDSFDTYYTGKLVIVNGHEYEWNGSEWVDLGEATREQRNVKFSEYFPDQASFTTKTINNVHWDMSRPAATSDSEDVFFSYDGPSSSTSSTPRFSMYYNNGVYTDTGFTDRNISELPQDSDGYYYYNFGGEMYLSNRQSSFSKYLNYTTWNYAYTFIDTIRYPKYYTEKLAPTISTLYASTIYRNSAHLTTLMRNDAEMAKIDYMSDDILKKGGPVNDEILYTSTDGNIVEPYDATVLPTIVSNTYVDGKGVIKFASDLTSIGKLAFFNLDTLKSVSFPYSLLTIGISAFTSCENIDTIKFGPNITTIGDEAFYSCSSLTSITIPNSVTSIGSLVFNLCYGLTSIIVKSGNTVYDSRNNCNAIIETATNTLIYGCQNTIIPNSVTDIGGYAFYYCKNMTSITIPNSVTSIGSSAFAGCNGLTSIDIPNSVTSIGSSAFLNCHNFTSFIIPNSITRIADSTFSLCSGLTSITIPNSVTSIGANAFSFCSSLTSITIPNSVTSIGNNAFGSISAKILFSKLYSTYTNKIFGTPITNTTYTFNVEFNISEIPTDYNISSMLPQHTGKKGTITYNIYTDYEPCKVQVLALANSKTIVNVYHIDGTSWT